MAKYYRQNASYGEIIQGDGENSEKQEPVNHGNTRLPFGLCQRYGIQLPDRATPRQAWDALKGKGITPTKAYSELENGGYQSEKRSKGNADSNDSQGNEERNKGSYSTDHMTEQGRRKFDDFQSRTSGKHMLHEEALILSPDGSTVLEKRGKDRQVSFTLREASMMKGCDLIHNHPSHYSVLSPADADSSYDRAKSCTMCDLDGNRMTIVYDDDISDQERIRFYLAYERAFSAAQKVATDEFSKRAEEFRASIYPDVKRKTRYYQDYRLYQEVVKREIMSWATQNSKNYKVEIYYEKH